MAKTVKIELHNGEEITYTDVTAITEEGPRFHIYRLRELLAVINKDDVKNLHTKES